MNFQFSKNKGVTRAGGHQGRDSSVVTWRNGPGAGERQDPENTRGQLVVEIIVAFGLASLLIPGLFSGFVAGRSGKVQETQKTEALAYLKEAEEAARSVREADWNTFAVNGTFHPVRSGNAWLLAAGTEAINEFTRSVIISDAYRNSSGTLVDVGGTMDPATKKITLKVTWGTLATNVVENTYYLTRWKNISSTLNASGTLLNQGNGDWCAPSLTFGSMDLGNATAKSISAIQGRVTTGTGQAAAGFTFVNSSLTDPAAPAAPSATITYFDGPTKTNDVFTETNYTYIATDSHSKDIDIINLGSLSGGKYTEAGYFDSPNNGSSNADTVTVSGNVGYMTIGDMLYNFDLTIKTGSRPKLDLDGFQLPASATKMVVYGQRLFISTTSSTYQIVVVDISSSTNLEYITKPTANPGRIHVNGLSGKSIYINSTGTRSFLATATSGSLKEMFVVNIDESSASFGDTVGSYETNGMDPTGIVLTNLPKVIVVGAGGEQYQVVDVTDDTNPTRCGGLTAEDLNGVATVFTAAQRAYSYIITNSNSNQLKIIEGGPGGNGSGGGLTVESGALDAGHSVIFNRIGGITVAPEGVTATYQIAVSTDCSTYNYTGSFTTAGGQIPLNINPGQCFKYKVTFSGPPGGVSTAVSVNYSP